MKSNSARLLQILSAKRLGFFSLVSFDWNKNYRFTDYGGPLVWNGETYHSNTPLVSLDPIRYSNIVDREAFRFNVSGIDADMLQEINAGIVHKPVRIRMVFTIDGIPKLGLDDTLSLYDGYVSGTSLSITGTTRVINIECTAPLSDLDATGAIFTTKDGMDVFSDTDTSFDKVFEGSESTTLRWGKK